VIEGYIEARALMAATLTVLYRRRSSPLLMLRSRPALNGFVKVRLVELDTCLFRIE
jgi:hypothetical protein